MAMRIATLSLLTVCCLMLAVAPAMADTVFYNNGPTNGDVNAWTINFGFTVSDSYTNTPGFNSVSDFHFVYWDASTTDLLTSVDLSFGTTSFGGTPTTICTSGAPCGVSGLPGLTNTLLGFNGSGYALYQADWVTRFDIPIPATGGYVTLSNACTTSGCSVVNPIYWDENSGPSTAYENTVGSIPSESFTLSGERAGTTPEPSSIMLFGSGILGLAGVLRRRLNR